MYYWQNEPDPEPVKVKVRITRGEIYLRGYADAVYGRPVKRPRGKRAREAYDKGFAAGLAMKQTGAGNNPIGLAR